MKEKDKRMNKSANQNNDRQEATQPILTDLESPNAEEIKGARRQYRPIIVHKDIDKLPSVPDEEN